jgi:Tol biopolymer transport system component
MDLGGGDPVLDATGRWIAYARPTGTVARTGAAQQVFLMDLELKSEIQITSGSGAFSPKSVIENGERILVEGLGDPRDGGTFPGWNVWLVGHSPLSFVSVSDLENAFTRNGRASAHAEPVAFTSDGDLIGGGQNGDLRDEVFLYYSDSGQLVQLTHTVDQQFSGLPAVDEHGRVVAYVSNGDPTGGNPSHSLQIYMSNADGSDLLQVTSGLGSTDPDVSRDGERISFSSIADLTGGNVDGNSEVFLFDVSHGQLTQVTDTPYTGYPGTWSGLARLDSSGRNLAFLSTADLVEENGDGSLELFLATCPLPIGSPLVVPALSPYGVAWYGTAMAVAGIFLLRWRGSTTRYRL